MGNYLIIFIGHFISQPKLISFKLKNTFNSAPLNGFTHQYIKKASPNGEASIFKRKRINLPLLHLLALYDKRCLRLRLHQISLIIFRYQLFDLLLILLSFEEFFQTQKK